MSAEEIAGRARQTLTRRRWRSRHVRPGGDDPVVLAPASGRRFAGAAGAVAVAASQSTPVAQGARDRLVKCADAVVAGEWDVFGSTRRDMVRPDWFLDHASGRSAPGDQYAFDVAYRDELRVGNVKNIWELSRHHHVTVLASAYRLSGDERYAQRVAEHLQDWWSRNPFLSGVHWTSGIELGIRLVSWVWTRRLLDGWGGVADLFEGNDVCARQVHHHCEWLAAFPSAGSSANNHVVAEAAGLLAASSAFPWSAESAGWRSSAAGLLCAELDRNTFPSGLNRELATDYHGLVLELGLVGALEAERAGHPMPDATWGLLCRMTDALAAVVDANTHPPRQGDADNGHVLVVDDPGFHRWESLMWTGAGLFGAYGWWPTSSAEVHVAPDVRSALLVSMAAGLDLRSRVATATERPRARPSHLADAGMTILRTRPDRDGLPELWVRADGGPHGFLSIAAHAHADALSIEVRVDGVDIVADPGTYCYHGEPEWRAYFRSTRAHNTVELAGTDQSVSGGPFLWVRHARTSTLAAFVPDDARAVQWEAEHDGYSRLDPPATHRRTVRLDRGARVLEVVDELLSAGGHALALSWHLGPSVEVTLDDDSGSAQLAWGADLGASIELPGSLVWTAHRGAESPPLGWYSPGFGRKGPSVTLVGVGSTAGAADRPTRLVTRFTF